MGGPAARPGGPISASPRLGALMSPFFFGQAAQRVHPADRAGFPARGKQGLPGIPSKSSQPPAVGARTMSVS
jgi:hypothetical protein